MSSPNLRIPLLADGSVSTHFLFLLIDYSVAVLGGMAIIALIDWIVHGRKHFRGPDAGDLPSLTEDGVQSVNIEAIEGSDRVEL